MAINREHLKSYLACKYSGPGVARRLEEILVFLLDQSEAEQQAAIDAWKGEYKIVLESRRAEAVTQEAALKASIAALE